MLIDAHAHLVTYDPAYPVDPPRGSISAAAINNPMTIAQLLTSLRENGVAGAVAVQRAQVFGYDNSYVLDAAAEHPDVFRAMCVIDGQADDAAATVRQLAGRGAAAIRLTAPGGAAADGPSGTDWFAGEKADRVWAAVADAGLSMCLHLYRWNRDESLRALTELCSRYPGVPVVLDHVASVDTAGPEPFVGSDSILPLVDHEQVYVKITTLNFAQHRRTGTDDSAVMRWLVGAFGADRILWGSDVTQTPGTHREMIEAARAATADLPEPQAAAVLGGTAARLYGFGTAGR